MGGTKILGAAINSREGIIARVKKPTEINSNHRVYVNHLAELVNDVVVAARLKPQQVKAVCLGVPGLLNPFSGVIAVAPNLGLKNFNIKQKLEKLIPYPVLIENDVNLGALGIKYFGLGKNAKDMLVVFIGTGIGGALIFDDRIFRGANFAAGEIGHINIDKKGPLCGCGKRGCFESFASRASIVKAIKKDLVKNKKSVLTKIVGPGKQIKSRALAEAVKAGDKLVIAHLTNACVTIGQVLSNTTNLLNLDLIVLGGGLIEALDNFMMPIIRKSFRENVLKDSAKGLKILPTKLGDDAALYGGIPLAEEFLKVKV
ncbi:MAG: ROK family protein [Ignavibacteriales bacterium]|nr:MAG: ROK family protein [Ignavibacteriales bacterium]